ncbi:RasGEF domain protein [Dictyocaulus viviparus]|uniref:RasGEF domain protein n=1 Tax=Dictyocaulus viviparus TaxID=29172 RepID=A0A0D8Y4W2_DICVI|nr:RasGEF domain protein [Dictyocaulus viviparus]
MSPYSTCDSLSGGKVAANQFMWANLFVERIYQLCGTVHPGMAIDHDAVLHIRDLINQIINEILEQKLTSVVDLDKAARKLLPVSCHWIAKDAWDAMYNHAISSRKFHSGRFGVARLPHDLHCKMAMIIKDSLGKEKEKKDREKDKEIDKMACYLIAICEGVSEDIMKWTGNYVKNIRDSDMKINLQNLKIALSADKALMQLCNSLRNDDEDQSPGSFLSNFYEFDLDDSDNEKEQKNISYESIASDFLKEERLYLRGLNQVNVFRRRLETVLQDEDKIYLRLLFGNLSEIHELTVKMERTLEDSIEMSDSPCIGMGIWELAEAYEFDGYVAYMKRGREDEPEVVLTQVIMKAIDDLLENKKYQSLFGSDDRSYSISLDGPTFCLAMKYVLPNLLYSPLLHFFRYVEYVNKLLKHSWNDEDRTELQNSKLYLTTVGNQLEQMFDHDDMAAIKSRSEVFNRFDSRISQLSRLQEIQRSIEGFEGNPIVKFNRDFIKEGDLQMIRPSLTFSPDIIRKGRWKTERHIFLFDHLLVFCKKHKTYKFKERITVNLMDIVDIKDNDVLRHSFRLESREKPYTTRTFTMICRSAEEKMDWMSALVTVNTKSILDRVLDGYEKEEAKRIPLIIPGPDQYRFAEPDSEENISFEDYTSSSGIPVVKNGTVLKLVERLTYHQYTDNKYVQTFLISYRSFCTPSELLEMLIERFNVPVPNKLIQNQEMRGGPLAGRYDTVQSHGLSGGSIFSAYSEQSYQRFRKEYERPIQRRVLSVLYQWVKNHWYDFENDPTLLEALERFLQTSCEQKLTNQHKKFCKNIINLIEKKQKQQEVDGHVYTAFDFENTSTFQPKKPEPVWHAVKQGDVANYDLLTLHPLEIGRQLTLLHFDLYRAIKPIELVGAAWTKHDKYRRSPQLLKLTDHSTLLTYWVSRSIVETESLEERVAMFTRVLEVMSVFEELHNFTGLVAFQSALNSACVHRLSWCWERLDHEKVKTYDRFAKLCEPRYIEMQKRIQSINPPCVPFFVAICHRSKDQIYSSAQHNLCEDNRAGCHYLSNIFFFEAGNSTFVKSPGGTSSEIPRQDAYDQQSPSASNKKVLVQFLKCRRISDLIREIQMYQNQPYALQVEKSIRVRHLLFRNSTLEFRICSKCALITERFFNFVKAIRLLRI